MIEDTIGELLVAKKEFESSKKVGDYLLSIQKICENSTNNKAYAHQFYADEIRRLKRIAGAEKFKKCVEKYGFKEAL